MESIAVVRFRANDHEGKPLESLGYGAAVLLVRRFNRSRRLAAKLVEVRDSSSTGSGTEPTGPASETHTIRPVARSDRDVPLSATRATHWIRGEILVEETQATLVVEMTSIGVGIGESRQVWATDYDFDVDLFCEMLNQVAIDCVKRITKVEPEYASRLTLETRSFEALTHYFDALESESPQPLLERAIAEDPWFIAAHSDLAIEYLEAEDRSGFDGLRQQMLQAGHVRRQTLAQELVLMGMRGRSLEAFELSIVALELAPDDPYLQEAASELSLERGGDTRILDVLERASSLCAAANALLATLHAHLEHAEQAERYSAATLAAFEAEDNLAEGYYRLGINAMRIAKPDVAERYLRGALERDKNHEAARANLAAVYLHGMRFGQAAELLGQSNADDAISQSNLALALRHTGKLKQAEHAAQRAVEADPMHPQAWGIIGDLARVRGDAERAISAFRTAAELEPKNPVWKRELGRVLFHSGQLQDAVVAFRDLLEQNETMAHQTPEVLCVLAQFAEQVQGPAEAEQLYRRALRLNAGLWQAANNLGILLVEQERFEDARYWFERGLELNPDNAELKQNLARIGEQHAG